MLAADTNMKRERFQVLKSSQSIANEVCHKQHMQTHAKENRKKVILISFWYFEILFVKKIMCTYMRT